MMIVHEVNIGWYSGALQRSAAAARNKSLTTCNKLGSNSSRWLKSWKQGWDSIGGGTIG